MRLMRVLFVILLILVMANSYIRSEEKKEDNSKEIQLLKKEIREIRRLLKKREAYAGKKEFEKHKRKIAELQREVEALRKKLAEHQKLIDFSGFFDVTASEYSNNPNIFEVGDFELDLEKSFGANFQVGAALVFNNDGAELAVGFIDFHFFGGSLPARGRLFNEKGFHLQIGKFDIPFGNDWLYFASVDRVSITAPLSTDIVMLEGLNDTGIRALSSTVYYNLTLHILKGTGEGVAYGGRIGFTPFNNPYILNKKQIPPFEIGFSYLKDNDKNGKEEENAWALDFEAIMGGFRIQSEYIKKSSAIGSEGKGGHCSVFYSFKLLDRVNAAVYSRYDWCDMVIGDEKSEVSSFTGGVNFNLFDISHLKVEYRKFLKQSDEHRGSSISAQLVITF